jgi:hypothetical protein
MKLGSLLVLFALLMGIASEARSATPDHAQLQSLIEDAKGIMQEMPSDVEYARALELGILSAFATGEAYDCFYAGWPSQLTSSGGHRFCARPTTLPIYEKYTKGLNCRGSTMACNPLLFGNGASGTGLCVAPGSTAFSQCESKANALGAKKYDFIGNLQKDAEMLGELQRTLQLVKEVCISGKIGTQKGTQMCSKFKAKLDKVEALLGSAPPPPQNLPAPKPDSGSNTPEVRKSVAEMLAEPNKEQRSAFDELLASQSEKAGMKSTPVAKSQLANTNCADCNEQKQTEAIELSSFDKLLKQGTVQPAQKTTVTDTGSTERNGTNWLTDGQSDAVRYERIRKKYFESGKCHRWNRLPPKGHAAFVLSLFSNEVRVFHNDMDRPATVSETAAFSSLTSALGWQPGSDSYKKLDSQIKALPAEGTAGAVTARKRLQQDLIRELSKDNPSLQKVVDARASAIFSKEGISDCDFPKPEVFATALSAIRKKGSKGANKPDIVTVVDRSLPRGRERVFTFNLKSEDVLFASEAGFGDAKPNSFDKEAAVCSNTPDTNASPFGVAETLGTRAGYNHSFTHGTFLKTETNTGSKVDGRRGLAFHESGGDVLGSYSNAEEVGQLYDDALTKGGEPLKWLLNRSSTSVQPAKHPGSTNGCIGIPEETVTRMQRIIEEGSYVYIHCPASMIR